MTGCYRCERASTDPGEPVTGACGQGRKIGGVVVGLPRTIPCWLRAVPWTGCLVAVGLGLRLYHYLRDPSMWHDEAALVLNVLDKGFRSLWGPLFFAEAAPPLFLWV